ncbi:hypothetical protein SAMN05443667_10585 [Flavobacterium gillisiae]|uniref:Uncharacterized protein n=1 Tax=Flavobacterium gillisiae TaxID=150146 RepID=A0A1H4BUJ0_9FLAO|nr:hypothetical protein [Flavobacterium gillisiae]SEA51826.1 hypothetical protein SAMN05443667_10585 [Flavobacterium gillisiae]
MKNSNNIFKKFVLITSILNFPIGIMMIAQAISSKTGEALITNSIAGAFIIFAGASLIWSLQDINTRASIILWNGLVRLFNVFLVSYATTVGEVPQAMLYTTGMDLVLAIVFIVGSVQVTGIPFSKLIVGKTN